MSRYDCLFVKYPTVMDRKILIDGSISCGGGWFDIVESAVRLVAWEHKRQVEEKVEPLHRVVITQIKEKFGGLRIYTNYSTEFVDGVISMAEHIASKTCEETGKFGSLHASHTGWLRTLNPDWANEHGYELVHKMP